MDGDYEPYDHREVIKPTSTFATFIHLVKCCFGIGVLAIPVAIANAGYVIAPILAVVVSFICLYGIHILMKNLHRAAKEHQVGYVTYPKSIEHSITKEGGNEKLAVVFKWYVRIFLCAYPIGICVAYVTFMAQQICQIFGYEAEDAEPYRNLRIASLILIIPCFLANCIPNLKDLMIMSLLANILTFTCFTLLFYYIFRPGDAWQNDYSPIGQKISKIPSFIGTTLFALEAVSVMVSLEENMKNPRKFRGWCGVFNISMIIVISFYSIIGTVGYLKYGQNMKGNLVLQLPTDEKLSLIVKGLFGFTIFGSYPLQLYPAIEIIWIDGFSKKWLKTEDSKAKRLLCDLIFRFCLTLFTVLVAIALPDMDAIVTLVGGVCIGTLGLFLPAFMDYRNTITIPDKTLYNKLVIALDIFVMMFAWISIVLIVFGVFT